MATNSEVNEIQVNIPSEKLNDLEFLQHKLLEVSFRALREISEHSDRSFVELVTEFIPDETCINNTFLEEWGLTKEDLNFKTEKKMKKITPTKRKLVKKTKSTKKPIKSKIVTESVNLTEPSAIVKGVTDTIKEKTVQVTPPEPKSKDEPVQVNVMESTPVKKTKIIKKKKLKRKKTKKADALKKAAELKKEAEEAAKELDNYDNSPDEE